MGRCTNYGTSLKKQSNDHSEGTDQEFPKELEQRGFEFGRGRGLGRGFGRGKWRGFRRGFGRGFGRDFGFGSGAEDAGNRG
jgi:hypothetical protein